MGGQLPPPAEEARVTERAELRLVNPETGELTETCPNCAENERVLAELERKYRGALSQIGNLRADRAKDAEAHKLFPKAKRLFDLWCRVCDHPKSEWLPDRFWLIEPYLSKFGEVRCCRAILGAAFDPYTTRRKNGTMKPHNGWDLIFRSPDKMDEFEARAPARFTDAYIEEHL
jgi:hypothetical protein